MRWITYLFCFASVGLVSIISELIQIYVSMSGVILTSDGTMVGGRL